MCRMGQGNERPIVGTLADGRPKRGMLYRPREKVASGVLMRGMLFGVCEGLLWGVSVADFWGEEYGEGVCGVLDGGGRA